MECPLVKIIQFSEKPHCQLSTQYLVLLLSTDRPFGCVLTTFQTQSFFFKISTYNKEAQILNVCTKLVDNVHMNQSEVILQRAVFLLT